VVTQQALWRHAQIENLAKRAQCAACTVAAERAADGLRVSAMLDGE
jgi:hypothetical protein